MASPTSPITDRPADEPESTFVVKIEPPGAGSPSRGRCQLDAIGSLLTLARQVSK